MTDGSLRRQHRFTVLPEHLIRDGRVSDRAMRLWCILDRYAGADGQAFPSRTRLCADLGDISPSSLDRAMNDLCKAGWLSKERRYKGGPNDYTVLVVPVDEVPAEALRGVSSPVTTPPADTTGDVTPASPVTTGVTTSDDEKEASSKEPEEKENPSLRSGASQAPTGRGSRLPDDWQPSEEMKDWFRQQPFAHAINPVMETEKFKDYWKAAPGQRGVKIDWPATWRNWMRSAADRRSGGQPHRPAASDEYRASIANDF